MQHGALLGFSFLSSFFVPLSTSLPSSLLPSPSSLLSLLASPAARPPRTQLAAGEIVGSKVPHPLGKQRKKLYITLEGTFLHEARRARQAPSPARVPARNNDLH